MKGHAWLAAPPEDLLAERAVLLRAHLSDAEALVDAVNASREHLRPWMPWAWVPATPESIGSFLAGADASWEGRTEFQYLIADAGSRAVLGCCGLHARIGAGALEIGYWVRVDRVRRGLASAAAGALTRAAFGLPDVERVEIHCDAANVASARVPRRLGYRLDRIENHTPTTPGETDKFMIWIHEPPT